MTALKAKFDGRQIEVPQELRRSNPSEVVIVFDEAPPKQADSSVPPPSIWDAFGKAPEPRDAVDLEVRLREERDSWGER